MDRYSREILLTRIFATMNGRQILAVHHIMEERAFQDGKHGPIDSHGHTLGEWLLIMEAELMEAKTALIKGGSGRHSLRAEVIQIIATGLAMLEQHGTLDPHDGRQI